MLNEHWWRKFWKECPSTTGSHCLEKHLQVRQEPDPLYNECALCGHTLKFHHSFPSLRHTSRDDSGVCQHIRMKLFPSLPLPQHREAGVGQKFQCIIAAASMSRRRTILGLSARNRCLQRRSSLRSTTVLLIHHLPPWVNGFSRRTGWEMPSACSLCMVLHPVSAGCALFASAWKSDVRSLLPVSGRAANEGKDEEEAVPG